MHAPEGAWKTVTRHARTARVADSFCGAGWSGQLAHGLGNQLVWGGTTPSIRSYAADGGAVDLVPLPSGRTIRKLRLSTYRVVWISATPTGGTFKVAQWHWSPRTTEPGSIVVHDGPTIPTIFADGGTDMMTGGDLAATIGYDGLDRIFVRHITTGDVLDTLMRVDLAQLSALVTALSKSERDGERGVVAMHAARSGSNPSLASRLVSGKPSPRVARPAVGRVVTLDA